MKQITETKPKVHNINKPAYFIFLLAGIYFLIQKDLLQAAVFWGSALIFDSFDTEIRFNKRPVYQQLRLQKEELFFLV